MGCMHGARCTMKKWLDVGCRVSDDFILKRKIFYKVIRNKMNRVELKEAQKKMLDARCAMHDEKKVGCQVS